MRASSLLLFLVATFVIALGAALELFSDASAWQVVGNLILLFLSAVFTWYLYNARGRLR